MACSHNNTIWFFFLAIFTVLISPVISSRVMKLPVTVESPSTINSYCESWRLAVETNNAITWKVVPSECVSYLETYYNKGQFDNDYNVVARYALDFAKTVKIGGDGKDAWVFDVDETLLSNLDYYKAHTYGAEPFNSKEFNEWVVQGTTPGYVASLKLYQGLKKLGFTIILLTGRDEAQRSVTEKNLEDAGYSDWDQLLLRGHEDQGKAATQYKSEQRSKMVKKGFRLHGNTGDQWSDLQGFAVADRSFKVPNPLYYIA
ncbi:unnamed protein product [Eruca vesicaria subsp. sativa]|uniref:Acid phosphatase n=1 Tax=Eruca vesicaria subsp. sativa TaxID=29727 RepID=A0ABC8JL03_ERUVS|nr:unnamed protein product [Eruca vesicaria subsp. sativa]